MPKATFFNLDETKKKRIVDGAMMEFAKLPFKKVTVDNIVDNAGIPKGSFYQYFKDKKDIYKYLFEELSREKKLMLAKNIDQFKDLKLSTFIRQMYLAGMNHDLDNEVKHDLSEQFMKNCSMELREEILDIMIPDSNEFFKNVIEYYIEKGELKNNINVMSLSNMLTTMTLYISKNHHAMGLDKESIIDDIHSMLDIIEHGVLKEV